MIKNRSFMLGLGSGLIIGALLLQLMLSGGAAPMTKEQLLKEAAKLNLTVTDKAADVPATEGEEVQQNADPAAAGDTAATAPAGSAQPSASPKASPAASPKAASQPTDAKSPAKPTTPAAPTTTSAVKPKVTASPIKAPSTPDPVAAGGISVKIPTGITLSETADLLAEAGVVKDKAEFLRSAISRKANTKIQYGGYNFTKGESNDSIIDKLTTVK
ncbi:YceG-like family protein [compost metagenome]